MANSFYWYDLETSGLSPKWDRIVQFAGCRTDAELNLLDDEYITYVSLPDDVLPNPSWNRKVLERLTRSGLSQNP